MLVAGHLRRDLHGIAGLPVVVLAVDLREADAFEDEQDGLGVGMVVARECGTSSKIWVIAALIAVNPLRTSLALSPPPIRL